MALMVSENICFYYKRLVLASMSYMTYNMTVRYFERGCRLMNQVARLEQMVPPDYCCTAVCISEICRILTTAEHTQIPDTPSGGITIIPACHAWPFRITLVISAFYPVFFLLPTARHDVPVFFFLTWFVICNPRAGFVWRAKCCEQ